MKVLKRNGKLEVLSFDKILKRLSNLRKDNALGEIEDIDTDVVAQKVIERIYDGISSKEMDDIASEIAISMSIDHPGYGLLASRISISNLHKSTPDTFHKCIVILHKAGIINERVYKVCCKYKKELNELIVQSNDYTYDYFGFKTLERSYLLRKDNIIIERPQYMLMRVSVSFYDDLEKIKESYIALSNKRFTHASPTLFNAGSMREQNSSCYLLSTSDSITGIYKTITDCAHISKYAGGIGISISNIRAKGSRIRSTNGHSDGIVPMLKVYNETARYVNQSSRRNGSFAVYLEPHHADVMEFLEMKKNTGDPGLRARDLFYAMWISDLFMEKVQADEDWYLMCPDECPRLDEVYGKEYVELYESYVTQGKYRKVIKARELWTAILVSQIETGTPYMTYKDHINSKSNQKNVGIIKSSNLCSEIVLYNTPQSTAVCNIATVSLPAFVEPGNNTFNFESLGETIRLMVRNLNRVIDVNFYPTPESEHNNKTHRPIAVGVQGFHNVLMKMKYPFDSENTKDLNKKIFECIQYNCIYESCILSKLEGPYETYKGSPISEGQFQHNMWGVDESTLNYPWDELREMVMKYGVRNSLLTALPPTASTSQILGNVESFEVMTSNFYMRRVLSGNYPIINKYLVNDLIKLGLWTPEIKQKIINNDGSVQNIKEISQNIKDLYKTTWEVSQKTTIDLSADRAPFIDHSQSLNIFIKEPTIAKLSSMHFYGWKKGLKSGLYYLRSRPATEAEKFTVNVREEPSAEEQLVCSIDNKDECVMCSG